MDLPTSDAGDRFAVEALAGTGGMGAVYRARDLETGLPVALKFLRGAGLAHADRFEREAELLAQLSHPAIVRYVAHGWTKSGEPWLAMQWLQGEDLAERLERGALTRADALSVARRVAGALGAAHRGGVVHRDIKPSNVLLEGGRVEDAMLIDFGVARVQSERWTAPGVAIGTPWYMAPEQARGAADVDARADVFSLGCVLFQCLTGRVPFPGEHLMAVLAKILFGDAPRVRELRPAIDGGVDSLVGAMLAKDKAQRPADGDAVADAIDALPAASEALLEATVAAPAVAAALGPIDQVIVNIVAAHAPLPADGEAPVTLRAGASSVHRELASVVATFGGRAEWLADGSVVIALSGPGAATDRAALAARCALAVRAVLPPAEMVLTTGRGVVGSERTAGEAIDRAAAMLRASRTQAATPAAEPPPAILVDEATDGLLPPRFVVAGTHRGRALIGVTEGAGVQRTLRGRPTPHVGRDRELRLLTDLYAECVGSSEAVVVVIAGDAGSGKTRLVQELWRVLDAGGRAPARWSMAGDPLTAGAPLAMLPGALRRALDLTGTAVDAAELAARIAPQLAAADGPRVAAFVGELLGIPSSDGEHPELAAARRDPMLMGDQVRRAVLDLARAQCAVRPLAIVLEDLHWGDKETTALVGAAIRDLAGLPLFVVAATRAEDDASLRAAWHGRSITQLTLGKLSRRASEQLVKAVLGDEVPQPVLARLAERGDEGPLYLEELLRAEIDGRGEELPPTLLAMIHTRLAALDEVARRALRAAAVFGRSFVAAGVARLAGLLDEEASRALQVLAERDVVVPASPHGSGGAATFGFRHAVLREAAYGMLTDDDLILGHHLAAQWLESAGERDAVVLADHYQRGNDRQRAANWYGRAASEALERNGFDAAIEAARRAIDCGAPGEPLGGVYLVMADAYTWKGDFGASETNAQLALTELRPGTERWFDAAARFTAAADKLGHVDAATDIAEAVCEAEVTAGLVPAWGSAAARMASHLVSTGRRQLALRLLERVSPLAEDSTLPPAAAAQVHLALGMRAHYGGDALTALSELELAARLYELAGDLRHCCHAAANVGYLAAELGDYERAEQALRRAIDAATKVGIPNAAAYALHNLGLVLAHRGRLDEGKRAEQEALELAVAHHDRRLETGCRMYLSRIALVGDQPQEARRQIQAALALAPVGSPVRAEALAVCAQVELREGRPREALVAAEGASAMSQGGDAPAEPPLMVRLVAAEAMWACGRRGDAITAIRAAESLLLERAGRLSEPSARARFLHSVPDNARIMLLAAAWAAQK